MAREQIPLATPPTNSGSAGLAPRAKSVGQGLFKASAWFLGLGLVLTTVMTPCSNIGAYATLGAVGGGKRGKRGQGRFSF
jgi:hypothetical protein